MKRGKQKLGDKTVASSVRRRSWPLTFHPVDHNLLIIAAFATKGE